MAFIFYLRKFKKNLRKDLNVTVYHKNKKDMSVRKTNLNR